MYQHRKRALIRWLAIIVGVIAYAIALNTKLSLVNILLLAYGAVVQLAPPVYAAFLWRRATATGVIAGLIAGIVVTGVCVFRPDLKPFGLHEGLIGLVANMVVLVVVSAATSQPNEDHVREWFETSRTP